MFAASLISESSVVIVVTSCVTVLPEITKSPVIDKLPAIVCPPVVRITVLSTENATLFPAPFTTDVIPSPPTNVNVSDNNDSVSVPVSPAIDRFVATETLDAEVNLPSAATVNTGMFVVPPYVPAATPLAVRSTVSVTLAEPSIDTLPVASPARPRPIGANHFDAVAALPTILPEKLLAVITLKLALPAALRKTSVFAVAAAFAASIISV